MRVRTDAPGAAGIEVGAQREQAVAEIGLGGRADRNGGAAVGDAAGFFRRQVGGVHQRPARIDGGVGQQPLHRSRAADRQAVLYLADLFGDVDVQARIDGQRLDDAVHRIGRHREQDVLGAADAPAFVLPYVERFEQSRKSVVVGKRVLVLVELGVGLIIKKKLK